MLSLPYTLTILCLSLRSRLQTAFPAFNLSDLQDHPDDRCGTAACALLTDPARSNETAVSLNTSG